MTACTRPNCSNDCDDDSPKLACKHKLNLCPEHLSLLIRTHIKKAETSVKCPNPTCTTLMNDADVRKWINAKDDDEYIRLCLRDITRYHSNHSWCPNCGNSQYHLGGNATPIVTCSSCRQDYCFKDEVLWTDGHSCQNYGTFEGAKLGNNIKGCPGCRLRMTRIRGCNHMICTQCRHAFCWACLATWNSAHYSCTLNR